MGFPPPPAGPPPLAAGAQLSVGVPPGLPAASLCGFKFPPTILFKFGINLNIPFPPAIPIPHLSLALNCSLSNPLSVSAGVKWGGGRAITAPPDPDLVEAAA